MRAKTAEKVREEHYPAPFRLIDLFERYGDDPVRMKHRRDRDVHAADGERDLAQSAPRVQAVGDAEGRGAERRLQAAQGACHRRRHDGRRHRRLVRGAGHAGEPSGSRRGADQEGARPRQGPVQAASAHAARGRDRHGALDRRSCRQAHQACRRGHRGDRREARRQAEPVPEARERGEAGRGARHQHLLAPARGHRQAPGRSRPAGRAAFLQPRGAAAAGRGRARRADARGGGAQGLRLRHRHQQAAADREELCRASSSTACSRRT